MSDTRVYVLNGTDMQTVAERVEAFLKEEKNMEVQGVPSGESYLIQATQKDTLRTIAGMKLATTVQMTVSGDNLNVTIGEGQWADKLGAGAVGLFIAWPLAVTAGIGAYKQKKLPEEILNLIGQVLMNPGQPVVTPVAPIAASTTTAAPTAAAPGQGTPQATATAQTQVCPQCQEQVPAGAKFCNNCGAKLITVCPECGANVRPGSKFCSECGHALQ